MSQKKKGDPSVCYIIRGKMIEDESSDLRMTHVGLDFDLIVVEALEDFNEGRNII